MWKNILRTEEVTDDNTRSHRLKYTKSQMTIQEATDDNTRPLPDNTQHLQDSNIHASGEIRTRNLNKREDADLRL
jgi:hypothetical protein